MRFWFRVTFAESNPFVVRANSERKDLSLMIKPDKTYDECFQRLVGYLEPIVFDKVYDYLTANAFSSLYKDMILFGPMSYLEHHCNSKIWFAIPTLNDIPFLQPPASQYKTQKVVRLKVRLPDDSTCDPAKAEKKILCSSFAKEKLLEVNYSSGELWFKCLCSKCTSTKTTITTKRKR
jgi:hypothetical protein